MTCPHFEYCELFWSLISEKVQLNWKKLWRQQEQWKMALQWGTRNCCLVWDSSAWNRDSLVYGRGLQSQEWHGESEQGSAAQCVSSYNNQGLSQRKLAGTRIKPEHKEDVPSAVDRNTSQRIMGMWEGVLPNIYIHISLFFVHRPLLEIRFWGRQTFGPKWYSDFYILPTSLFT